MTEMNDMLTELKKIVPPENFFEEPKTSLNEMRHFESTYRMSTYDFVNKKKDTSHIPPDKKEGWINTLETHLVFGGKVKGIND